MDARAHYTTLARYDGWATRRLFEAVDALSEADYRRDVGLYFKSVHGTLNHLLLTGTLLWYERFAHGGGPALRLDAEVEPDRAALRTRLAEAAPRWEALIETWPEARYAGRLDYVSTRGVARSMPFDLALTHVFNHATHHRGQVTAALTALGQPGPELDLLWMVHAEARA